MNQRIRKKQLKKLNAYINQKETWDLDISFAKYMVPRLKTFKKNTIGHPSSLESMDEWYAILDKMIDAFTYIADGGIFEIDFIVGNDEMNKKIEEGLDLFRKYYFNLWI